MSRAKIDKLRAEIIDAIKYVGEFEPQPYYVRWDGITFRSDDTLCIVEQVLEYELEKAVS